MQTVHRCWFEADAWRDPEARREFLALSEAAEPYFNALTGWMRRILADVWQLDLLVVEREFTLVGVNPALDDFKDLATQFRAHAEELARSHGRSPCRLTAAEAGRAASTRGARARLERATYRLGAKSCATTLARRSPSPE